MSPFNERRYFTFWENCSWQIRRCSRIDNSIALGFTAGVGLGGRADHDFLVALPCHDNFQLVANIPSVCSCPPRFTIIVNLFVTQPLGGRDNRGRSSGSSCVLKILNFFSLRVLTTKLTPRLEYFSSASSPFLEDTPAYWNKGIS